MPPLETKPNAALVADAGAFAPAVARVWPRPHRAYFEADAPRRRVAQIVSACARAERRALAEALETWSLRRIIAAYAPDAPPGFAEALKKLDGPAWSEGDYARLIGVLKAGGPGAKTLHHAAIITKETVAILDALPEALRRPRILAHLPIWHMAALAGRGAKRACGRDARAFAALADRLERARSTSGLFMMLIDAIGVEQLAPPPIPGADWLKPIASAGQIRSAALRFQNCLEGRIPWLLMGKGAYYEALGEEPAIVELVRDATGSWVVGEVRGHANAAVSGPLWARIRAHLERHGARVKGRRPDRLALELAAAAGW